MRPNLWETPFGIDRLQDLGVQTLGSSHLPQVLLIRNLNLKKKKNPDQSLRLERSDLIQKKRERKNREGS